MHKGRRRVYARECNQTPRADSVSRTEDAYEWQISGDKRGNIPRKHSKRMPSEYRLGKAGYGLNQQKRVQSVLAEPHTELMQRGHGRWKCRKPRPGRTPKEP